MLTKVMLEKENATLRRRIAKLEKQLATRPNSADSVQRLKKNQASFQVAQSMANLGSFEIDLATYQATWSKHMFHLFGIDPNQPVPSFEQFLQMIHPADRQSVLALHQQTIEQSVQKTLEFRVVLAERGLRYFRVTIRPDGNAKSKSKYLSGIILDITESKRTENELGIALTKYKTLFDNFPLGITVSDAQGNIRETNSTAEKLLGIPKAEHTHRQIGDSKWQIIRPDGTQMPSKEYASVRALEENRTIENVEMGIVKPDASVTWLNVTASPLPLEEYGVVITYGDITERKQSEQVLRKNEEFFRFITTHSPDVIFFQDRDLRYEWLINSISSMPLEQVIGKTDQELFPPAQAIPLTEMKKQILQTGKGQRIEIQLDVDGVHRWHDAIYQPTRDQAGKVNGIAAYVRDITERKQAEERLKQSETQFRALFDNMPMPGVIYRLIRDEQGEIVDWEISDINALGAASIGSQADQLIGKRALALFGSEVMEPYLKLSRHVATTGQPQLFETHFESNGKDYLSSVFMVGDNHYANISMDITERKQFEKQLRESEAKYRSLIDSQNSAISTIDRDGVFRYINGNGAKPFGVPDFVVGKKLHDLFPPHIADWQLNQVRQVIATQQGIVTEYQTQLAGKPSWRHVSIQPIRNPDGTSELATINSSDITERKQAEEDLRASEEKYRQLAEQLEERVNERTAQVQDLYDNAPVGYHSLDAQGRYLQINQTELDWLGYTRAEVLGKHVSFILASESSQTIDDLFQRFKDKGYVSDLELVAKRKDGTFFPILINAIAKYDSSHQYLASRSTLMDISERKKAEHALRESENRYRSIFENSLNGILITNPENGQVVDSNPAACQMWGGSKDELHQLGRAGIVDISDPRLPMALEERSRTGKFSGELNYRHKDGSIFPVEISSTLAVLPSGEQVANIFFTDITLRKKAEETLRQANLELERALRIKDEFLASMSHELRTPLNAILGLSEGLIEQVVGPLNDMQMRSLVAIESSGQHLLKLINDILDLSKIEAGALTLSLSSVDAQSLCNASLVFVREAAHKKNIKLFSTLDPEVRLISLDERRAKQMLVNLLSNAVKFTPEGGQVGLEMTGNRQENMVRFTVWDTGIGISEEGMSRLFRPFVQIDSSLTRRYEGTGLGLSLVSRMAEMHGGSVSVESELGKGSRFTITLPWTEPNQGTSFDESDPSSGARKAEPSIARVDTDAPLILIAEDNEATILTLSVYLEPKGYRLAIAHNGIEAITVARTLHPSLILMDLQMPDMDGLEATRRVRSDNDPQLANLPIVALTALAMPGDRERALAAGANAYLSKPVNMKQLVEMIERLRITR